MRIIPSLLLAAGLAAAVQVPVLSEPRSLPLKPVGNGGSADAWGDTLFAGNPGNIHRYVRIGDSEVLLDSVVSDSVEGILKLLPGAPLSADYLVVTQYRLLTLQWNKGPSGFAGLSNLLQVGWSLQGGWARDPADSLSPSPEYGLILCGTNAAYRVRKGFGGVWSPDDSMVFPNGGGSSCTIDASTGQGVVVVAPSLESTGFQFGKGIAWNLLNVPLKASDSGFSWLTGFSNVLTAWGGQWLAYTPWRQQILRQGKDTVQHLDSIPNPGYSSPFVKAVRHDSLVVFAIDSLQSSLVLAKWTPDTFFFESRISLGAPARGLMAMGDSVLWVQTDSALLSFRFSWQEAAPSGIESRKPLAHDLAVTEGPMGTGFLWNGFAPTNATIQGVDGRVVDRIRLNPGRTTWWRGSRSGLFLVRTPDGTSKFLVR